jgi:hypothetical protein
MAMRSTTFDALFFYSAICIKKMEQNWSKQNSYNLIMLLFQIHTNNLR